MYILRDMHTGIEYCLFQIESILNVCSLAEQPLLSEILDILQKALQKIENLYFRYVIYDPLRESCYKKNQLELRTWLVLLYLNIALLYNVNVMDRSSMSSIYLPPLQ